MRRMALAFFVLALGILACGQPAEEWQLRGWTVTPSSFAPTQTPLVVIWTATANATQTPLVVEVTSTPNSLVEVCVVADQAVNLRAAPNSTYYPIEPLSKGTKVVLTGTSALLN